MENVFPVVLTRFMIQYKKGVNVLKIHSKLNKETVLFVHKEWDI